LRFDGAKGMTTGILPIVGGAGLGVVLVPGTAECKRGAGVVARLLSLPPLPVLVGGVTSAADAGGA
jgi:hypothetical protein